MTNSGDSQPLAALMFDMSASLTGAAISISYNIVDSMSNLTFGTLTPAPIVGTAGSYSNHILDLGALGLVLDNGSTVNFVFQGVQGSPGESYFDNIGITAIPEPGSLLALSCVLGSGLLLRTRRRSFESAEAVAA